jgi:hypothetical protein
MSNLFFIHRAVSNSSTKTQDFLKLELNSSKSFLNLNPNIISLSDSNRELTPLGKERPTELTLTLD